MIGNTLKLIRIATLKYDTESKAARVLGISPSYINKIEKGVKSPSKKMLENMSSIYNIPQCKIIYFDSLDNNPKLND